MKNGDYVRICKTASVAGGVPACPMPLYSPGSDWGLSLPRDYCMEGFLAVDLVKGGHIQLDRRVRMGVVERGVFTSTRITTINYNEVRTYNSIWQVNRVPALAGEDNLCFNRSQMNSTTYVRVILIRSMVTPPPTRLQAPGNGAWVEGELIKRIESAMILEFAAYFVMAGSASAPMRVRPSLQSRVTW